MAYWDITADVSPAPFVGDALLGNLDVLDVVADVRWGLSASAGLTKNRNVAADTFLGPWSGTADLLIGYPAGSLSADTYLGAWAGAAELTRYAVDALGDPYSELHDRAFMGAWKGCPGPGATAAIAGEEAREVVFLKYDDVTRLQIVGRRIPIPGRPTAIGSNILQPDFRNRPYREAFLWVLAEETESPTGNPKLLCYECTTTAPLVATLELDRSISQGILWASNDTPTADFIVICGQNGAVQIRTDDAEMRLLAKAETGIYEPEVLDVQRRPELGDGLCDGRGLVWHILVFSRTGARGVVLEYRDVDVQATLTVRTPEIVANVALGPWTAAAALYSDSLRTIDAPAVLEWSAFASLTGEQPPPVYTEITAAVTLRPFTLNNTERNINAIEERVVADVSYAITGAAALEVS